MLGVKVQTSLGLEIIEDESHVLYVYSDLYSKQRSKLVKDLTELPLIEMSTEITDSSNINETNLNYHLTKIVSPYSTLSVNLQNYQSLHIHCHRSLDIQPNTPQYIQFQENRSYAVNYCVCTYFLCCSKERISFTEDMRQGNSNAQTLNNFTINLVRTSRIIHI